MLSGLLRTVEGADRRPLRYGCWPSADATLECVGVCPAEGGKRNPGPLACGKYCGCHTEPGKGSLVCSPLPEGPTPVQQSKLCGMESKAGSF